MMNTATSNRQESLSAPAARKTTKTADPPTLTDGKEPWFEDWLLLMSQKLAANADHFDTPWLRMAYVASRCEGKARKNITPCMRDDSENTYINSKNMLGLHMENWSPQTLQCNMLFYRTGSKIRRSRPLEVASFKRSTRRMTGRAYAVCHRVN